MNELDEIVAIRRTLDLLAGSEDSPYSTRSVAALTKTLNKQLKKLESGRSPRSLLIRFVLIDLFTPTGDLQEVSISNGWAEEYLSLAEVIDRATRVNRK
jgi:hypothetical protein